MNIAIDCETEGLDATKFVMSALIKEDRRKPIYFYNKKDMWDYIITLGKKLMKHKKVLNVYAHNHRYDFFCYVDINDPNITIMSEKPFIASYSFPVFDVKLSEQVMKQQIYFLDTWAIFKMPLRELARLIGLEKGSIPSSLTQYSESPSENIISADIKEYCAQDARIALQSIIELKKKLKTESINIRRLFTISQIAIQYMLSKMQKYDIGWYNNKFKKLAWSRHNKVVSMAYRGARNEAFQTGYFKHCCYIDINNLYGYSSSLLRFPKLDTERSIYRPLNKYSMKELFSKIGVSNVMAYNKDDEYGVLPVREKDKNYYPKKGKYMIGVYTHPELEYAIKNGYKIIDVEWSVIYDECENPFTTIMPYIYNKRKASKNKFDDYFYKCMMNHAFGKFGQSKTYQKIVIDSVEKVDNYLNDGFEILRGFDDKWVYKKDMPSKRKPYYHPIIPSLINAKARCIMHENFKKIPKDNLLYTDTDSILFIGDNSLLSRFVIGDKMGAFKVEYTDVEMNIRAPKTYRVDNDVKLAGIRKKDVSPENFDVGTISTKKMVTLSSIKDGKKLGTFNTEVRDLSKVSDNYEDRKYILDNIRFYIDAQLYNIDYFFPHIAEIKTWEGHQISS